MTLAIVLCFLLAAASVVIAALLFRGADKILDEAEPRLSSHRATGAAQTHASAGSAATETPKQRLRLVSNSGNFLGETDIAAHRRRNSFTYRVGKAQELSNFVASHRDDDGVWVYRRMGVEKE